MPKAFAQYCICDLICSELTHESYQFLLLGNWPHNVADLRLSGMASSSASGIQKQVITHFTQLLTSESFIYSAHLCGIQRVGENPTA